MLAAAASATGDNNVNSSGEQATSAGETSQQRQRKRRPRTHVPVAEDGIDGEFAVGRAQKQGGVGNPWVDSAPTGSSLPKPTYEQRQKFGRIMEDVLGTEKEEELPALLTKHIDFLLSVDVTRLTNDLIRCVRAFYVFGALGMWWCVL